MKKLSIIIILIAIISVTYILYISPVNKFKKRILNSADKVVVNISMGEYPAVKKEFNKNDIEKFIGFISYYPAKNYKCSYTGEIKFLENGLEKEENNISYQIVNPDCKHLVFMENDKIYSRKITKEGVDFLKILLPVENDITQITEQGESDK